MLHVPTSLLGVAAILVLTMAGSDMVRILDHSVFVQFLSENCVPASLIVTGLIGNRKPQGWTIRRYQQGQDKRKRRQRPVQGQGKADLTQAVAAAQSKQFGAATLQGQHPEPSQPGHHHGCP